MSPGARHVKPIDVVAWVCVQNARVLVTRSLAAGVSAHTFEAHQIGELLPNTLPRSLGALHE